MVGDKDTHYPIEVDGFEYHKVGTQQAERDKLKEQVLAKYNFPVLRFRTNESNEKEILRRRLLELQERSV